MLPSPSVCSLEVTSKCIMYTFTTKIKLYYFINLTFTCFIDWWFYVINWYYVLCHQIMLYGEFILSYLYEADSLVLLYKTYQWETKENVRVSRRNQVCIWKHGPFYLNWKAFITQCKQFFGKLLITIKIRKTLLKVTF